jgi:hypothetical protein
MKNFDELDFDSIKNNLKSFLQSQQEFESYEFDGSALSVLLDVLAYNTQYNALYTNMAVNESFLDSASKRSSVISLAKSLGYVASSKRSARAYVSVECTLPASASDTSFLIPKGTAFNGAFGDNSFIFYTNNDYFTKIKDRKFIFNDVEIIEGTMLSNSFTVTNTDNKFVIPNSGIDTSTILVKVKQSATSIGFEKFSIAGDLMRIKGSDKVYFIKQRDDGLFEIYFGNNSIGASVEIGNIIEVSYIKSSGQEANGSNAFTYQSGLDRDDVGVEVFTIRSGYGGVEEESIDSIKYNAPRAWVSQNRAVTVSDYETVLQANFPRIESIHVWGGQDNIPKYYGKVFISAKPYNALKFTDAEKSEIIKFLKLKCGVISVTPEIVDPDYMCIELFCNVYYNDNRTRYLNGQLQTMVKNKIREFSKSLNKFDSVFRYSKLSGLIDGVDEAITSNSIALRVRVPKQAKLDVYSRYSVNLDNPITPGTFYSTRFYTEEHPSRSYVKDNGDGILELYYEDERGLPFYLRDVGTIDYQTGSWDIPVLKITTMHDILLEFVFTPRSNDVASSRNIILTIKDDNINVSSIIDNIASGVSSGGSEFVFSQVR